MAGEIEFNRGKFKELVVYFSLVAEREGDEGFGMVKLNKLLYRADFEAYRLLGHSITGETYEKQQFGPVARDLPIVLDELGGEGRLYWQHIPSGPHMRDIPTPSEEQVAQPDLSMFPDGERKIIEKTLSELAIYGGKSVSDWSHEESVGWNVVPEYGQVIEYNTAFASSQEIPQEDLEHAAKFVREQGWVKNEA